MAKKEATRAETWDRFWRGRHTDEVYPPVSDIFGEIKAALGNLKGLRVLEVGVGTGHVAARLAREGALVWVLDISREALRMSREACSSLFVVQGDGTQSPFRDASFDLVYHQGLLEHFEDPMPLLRDNRRVLRPGGYILVDVPQKYHVYTLLKHGMMAFGAWPFGWETQFSPRSLKKLLAQAGFVPLRTYGYGFRPGLWYRVVRELARRVGLGLPLYPPGLGWWWRLTRALERALPWAPWLSATLGVVAKRP